MVDAYVKNTLDDGTVLSTTAEVCVPMVIYPDEAGGMMKALARGELDQHDRHSDDPG